MLRKATVWKVKLVGSPEPLHVMTAGSSFYDLGDISGLLKEAADEFGVSRDSEILSIEKSCVALGFTKLPNEGALALREDGTIAVNDPDRLAKMAGLDGNEQLPNYTSGPPVQRLDEKVTRTMASLKGREAVQDYVKSLLPSVDPELVNQAVDGLSIEAAKQVAKDGIVAAVNRAAPILEEVERRTRKARSAR